MENIIFNELEVSDKIKKAVKQMGFTSGTPIQSKAIPPMLNGEDIIAQAPTGTGKTCAFGIPMIEKTDPESEKIQAAVLCPTRELAIQISQELKSVSRYIEKLRIVPIYGGQPIDRQILALKRKPQIIVATPGRLMDHLRRRTIRLDALKILVLDEADEMLNMGFREDIDSILESVPKERQTVLFSATISKEIRQIANLYQKKNVKSVKTTSSQVTVSTVSQYYLEARGRKKLDVLTRLLDSNNFRLSLIFCNTKKSVDALYETLSQKGYRAEALHGDMKQIQRDRVMKRFKSGVADILIATDVAARGLDIDNVDAVFNYDIPNELEFYVHRIGRTGRANNTGIAYTFVSSKEMFRLKEIMKFTKSEILPLKAPSEKDVFDITADKLINKIKSGISAETTEAYAGKLAALEENGISLLDFTAALMNSILNPEQENSNDDSFISGAESRGMIRLFLSVGTLDKIRHRHIKEIIAANTPISGKDIGAIDIYDKFSFIEVPSEFADDIIKDVSGITYKGRKITIEKAQRRK